MKIQSRAKMFLVTLITMSVLGACQKDASPRNPVNKNVSRIEEANGGALLFAYNADGSTRSITASIDFGNGQVTTVYSFVNDGLKPVEISSNHGERMRLYYLEGALWRIENFEGNRMVSQNVLEYSNHRLVSNTRSVAIQQGPGQILFRPVYRLTYSYYETGNPHIVTTYSLNHLNGQLEKEQTKFLEEFDTKPNPLKNQPEWLAAVLFEVPAINNVVREKIYDSRDVAIESTRNEYTYDGDGYPVNCRSLVTAYPGGTSSITINFFY